MKTHRAPVREEHGASCSCNSCPQPEKQAADNSRRESKESRDKAVPEASTPEQGNSGGNTKVSWCSLQSGELRFAARAIRGLYFLAGCPAVQNC